LMRPNGELASAIYWVLTGALISFGFLGLMTIGIPFLLIGSIMAVFGLLVMWIKGVWAITVGLGGAPVYFVLTNVLEAVSSSGPPCTEKEGTVTLGPGESAIASCSPPIPEGYVAVLVFFGAIVFSGPVVRLFMLARGRP
jgi:hypothetical protein